MTDVLPPADLSLRAEQLGGRLRDLRKEAKLTGKELAQSANLSQPKISKIERGRVLPSPLDITRIGEVLDVDAGELHALVGEASELSQFSRSWKAIHREGLAGAQREVQFTERIATDVCYFQATLIPGLLQYRQYAREILLRANITGQIDVDDAVNIRMERQDLLHSQERRFRFVILEAALMARYVAADTMNIQLDLLASVTRLPNVSLGIVSSDTTLPVIPLTGFGIFDETTVIVEMLHGQSVLNDESSVSLYREAFADLTAVAQFDDGALAAIERVRRSI